MNEHLELEFIIFREMRKPKVKWLPFLGYEYEELSTIVRARVNIQDITEIEQITTPDGAIYENICNIWLKEIGPKTVNISFDEMCTLTKRKELGYVGYVERPAIKTLDL